MKLKNILFCLLIAGCITNRVKPTYILIDSSKKQKPAWIENISKITDKDTKQYFYYQEYSSHTDERLCQQLAVAQVYTKIAQEFSSELDNSLVNDIKSINSVNNSNVNAITKYNVKQFLTGIELEDSYIEQRKYMKSMGAEKDEIKYQCYILVKLDKNIKEQIIEKYLQKILNDDLNIVKPIELKTNN